jgi:DNA-binding transcriptional ArsR family regulator
MTPNADSDDPGMDTPGEAFAILGDETRLRILRALGEAGEPLQFSELYDRVEYDDPSNFNYHLKRLAGHFVEDTDAGYALRPEGRRVVKAVLAGFMTETPEIERTRVETPCFLCGSDEMEVSYRDGIVGVYCPACGGRIDGSSPTMEWADDSTTDVVGKVGLPSAGAKNRPPSEILRVGELWSCWIAHALARDACPECSAPVEHSIHVCEDHDTAGGRCGACGRESAITVTSTCTHCIRDQRFVFSALLLANTDVMRFMIDHGLDPLVPRAFHHAAVEETVLSADPFEARFTFTADGEALTLTVDDALNVVEVARERTVDTDR